MKTSTPFGIAANFVGVMLAKCRIAMTPATPTLIDTIDRETFERDCSGDMVMAGKLKPGPDPLGAVFRAMAAAPVDLADTARDCAISIDHAPVAGPAVALLSRNRSNFHLTIAPGTTPRTERFAIAKAIAIRVLANDLMTQPLSFSPAFRSELHFIVDEQTNRFATKILLPAKHIADAVGQGESVEAIAARFDVTPELVRLRIAVLDIDPNQPERHWHALD